MKRCFLWFVHAATDRHYHNRHIIKQNIIPIVKSQCACRYSGGGHGVVLALGDWRDLRPPPRHRGRLSRLPTSPPPPPPTSPPPSPPASTAPDDAAARLRRVGPEVRLCRLRLILAQPFPAPEPSTLPALPTQSRHCFTLPDVSGSKCFILLKVPLKK